MVVMVMMQYLVQLLVHGQKCTKKACNYVEEK